MSCPDDNLMAAYFDGVLDTDEVARIDAHVSECATCRRDLSAIAVVNTLREPGSGEEVGEVIPGDRIGRYVLTAERARGAMGIVATALDPELGRTIAIKVLQPDVSAHVLRQEARAMAKLGHPNVVSVHDVGEHAGRVYLAMELVDGIDLRRWLALERRSWRTILRTCILAGRGLAAAHRAGLVHRDVKPDNILCGPEDRVRIGDFGLATSTAADATGITGTPAYIAPEVWRKEPATARSDQWSYAATVYEALVGTPPFAGDTSVWEANANATKVERAAVRKSTARSTAPTLTFPARSPLPGPIKRALTRALAHDPAERYPSLDALLAELEAVLRPRWPWVALGAGLVVACAGVAAFVLRGSAPDPCQLSPSLIESAWDAPAIARAFAASGRKHGADSARRLNELFADYGKRWLASRIDACQATRVRGDQSEALLDARVRCLDRRRAELSELARMLRDKPSVTSVDRAVQAALELTPLETCTAAGVETDTLPVPPAIAPAVAALDDELARVLASRLLASQVDAGITQARSLVERAAALGHPPALARAVRVLAAFSMFSKDHARTERELDEALVATAAAHDDEGTATVWLQIVMFTAQDKGDPGRALELIKPAEVAVLRAGSSASTRASLHHAHGTALHMRGQYAEARRLLEQARAEEPLALRQGTIDITLCSAELRMARFTEARAYCDRGVATLEHELGPYHPSVGMALMTKGSLALELADEKGARVAFERSAELLEGSIGEGHIAHAFALNNLGRLEARTGDLARARRYFERAIALFEPLGHSEIFSPIANLARLERREGNYAAARTLLDRAITLATKTSGPESDRVATALVERGALEWSAGNLDAAQAAYERGLAITTKVLGEKSPRATDALDGLGMVWKERGDCRRAVGYFERVTTISEALFGADDRRVAQGLINLGDCQLALGDVRALASLERALAILDRSPAGDPFDPAATRWTLAQALWKLGPAASRPRALVLAREARALYAKSVDVQGKAVLPVIDQWLSAHAR